MYTRVCLCASAHREERWNWSKVATMVSGYYPTVLPQIAITNTITITITTSIARYARVDTIPCRHSKSGHYPHVKLKRWHYRKVETILFRERGHYRKVETIPFCERGHYGKVETIVKRERWHYRRVETFVKRERWHYRKVQTIVKRERWHYRRVETIVKRERWQGPR